MVSADLDSSSVPHVVRLFGEPVVQIRNSWMSVITQFDADVRVMLTHGTRAVTARSRRSNWVERLLQRCPYSVVVAALTNILARTARSVLAKGKAIDQAKWNLTELVSAWNL